MARVSKGVLGDLTGKIGQVVAKMRDGKQYYASLPAKYRMSKKPEEVAKRNRFKVNGRFARLIRKNDLLFRIWDSADVKANNAYNKISKVNFKLCDTKRPTDKNKITPDGFPLPVADVKDFPDRIEIEIEPFEILPGEEKITLILYLSFYEPEGENVYYEMSRLINYEQDEMRFIFRYSGRDVMLAEEYKQKTIFLAAVTEDGEGKIVRWSKTYGREMQNS